MSREPKILTPNGNYWVTFEGHDVLLRRGDTFHAGDPITVGREHMFAPIRLHGRGDAEQATAAPGEKRSVKLPDPAPSASGDVDAGKDSKQDD